MTTTNVVNFLVLLLLAVVPLVLLPDSARAETPSTTATPTPGNHCGENFNKVTACLNYATGKAATPTKECCAAVTDIKESDPACLCFIIQQTHNGSATLKSMGIQESKLLQLPSACNMHNASISECPKILGIPSTSPDYAIFTNASSLAAPTTPLGSTPSTPSANADATSRAPLAQPQVAIALVALAITFLGLYPISLKSLISGGW